MLFNVPCFMVSLQPKLKQRIASFFVPMIPLFQAGFLASSVGYGLGTNYDSYPCMAHTIVYVSQTQTVKCFLDALIYTGVFMAIC